MPAAEEEGAVLGSGVAEGLEGVVGCFDGFAGSVFISVGVG